MDINKYSNILELSFTNLDEVVENLDELLMYLKECLNIFKQSIYSGEGSISNNSLYIVNIKGIEVVISLIVEIDENSVLLFIATVNGKLIANCKLMYGKKPNLEEFMKIVNDYLVDNDTTIEEKLFTFNKYLPVPVYDVDQMINILNILVNTTNSIL